jgi:hypothetical protein
MAASHPSIGDFGSGASSTQSRHFTDLVREPLLNTSTMIFDVPTIVSYVSQFIPSPVISSQPERLLALEWV